MAPFLPLSACTVSAVHMHDVEWVVSQCTRLCELHCAVQTAVSTATSLQLQSSARFSTVGLRSFLPPPALGLRESKRGMGNTKAFRQVQQPDSSFTAALHTSSGGQHGMVAGHCTSSCGRRRILSPHKLGPSCYQVLVVASQPTGPARVATRNHAVPCDSPRLVWGSASGICHSACSIKPSHLYSNIYIYFASK